MSRGTVAVLATPDSIRDVFSGITYGQFTAVSQRVCDLRDGKDSMVSIARWASILDILLKQLMPAEKMLRTMPLSKRALVDLRFKYDVLVDKAVLCARMADTRRFMTSDKSKHVDTMCEQLINIGRSRQSLIGIYARLLSTNIGEEAVQVKKEIAEVQSVLVQFKSIATVSIGTMSELIKSELRSLDSLLRAQLALTNYDFKDTVVCLRLAKSNLETFAGFSTGTTNRAYLIPAVGSSSSPGENFEHVASRTYTLLANVMSVLTSLAAMYFSPVLTKFANNDLTTSTSDNNTASDKETTTNTTNNNNTNNNNNNNNNNNKNNNYNKNSNINNNNHTDNNNNNNHNNITRVSNSNDPNKSNNNNDSHVQDMNADDGAGDKEHVDKINATTSTTSATTTSTARTTTPSLPTLSKKKNQRPSNTVLTTPNPNNNNNNNNNSNGSNNSTTPTTTTNNNNRNSNGNNTTTTTTTPRVLVTRLIDFQKNTPGVAFVSLHYSVDNQHHSAKHFVLDGYKHPQLPHEALQGLQKFPIIFEYPNRFTPFDTLAHAQTAQRAQAATIFTIMMEHAHALSSYEIVVLDESNFTSSKADRQCYFLSRINADVTLAVTYHLVRGKKLDKTRHQFAKSFLASYTQHFREVWKSSANPSTR